MQLRVSDSRVYFGPTMRQTWYHHRRHRGEDNTVLVAREERLTRNNSKTPGLSYLMGDKCCEKPSIPQLLVPALAHSALSLQTSDLFLTYTNTHSSGLLCLVFSLPRNTFLLDFHLVYPTRFWGLCSDSISLNRIWTKSNPFAVFPLGLFCFIPLSTTCMHECLRTYTLSTLPPPLEFKFHEIRGFVSLSVLSSVLRIASSAL